MNKNKIFRYLVYIFSIFLIYICSLYVCNSLKVDSFDYDFESIVTTIGTYNSETTIFNIPVSETVIEVYGPNNFEIKSNNYTALFLLPLVLTVFILIIIVILTIIVKKAIKKIEI